MSKNVAGVIAVFISVIALVVGGVAVAVSLASGGVTYQTVEFTHAEVDPTQVTVLDTGVDGSTPGDERFFIIPATSPAGGLMTGSLTVVAPDMPEIGQEIRQSNLVFQFGAVDDQMVVGGVAIYEIADPTISLGKVVTRPILGGSGKYKGARGWVETTHNEDGTWVHVFRFNLN